MHRKLRQAETLHSLLTALLALAIVLMPLPGPANLFQPAGALAGPVDWQALPATAEGRQWWDAGSLRVNRQGNLTVLSRFQPADSEGEADGPEPDAATGADRAQPGDALAPGTPAAAGAPDNPNGPTARRRTPASSLYVMEIDCGQTLFRDTSINGIPQWGSHWQPASGDGLIDATIAAVCAAGADLLAGS